MYYTASRGGLQGVFAIFAHLSGSDKASPFGSNGDDRRQRRKQGVAVGAAASRMRARAKQTLGAATRAVSPQVTERARMLTVIRGRSDSIALTKSLLIAAWAVLSCRACPLSLAFARQLPQRGSHWQAGPLPTGRLRPDMAQKGGPCCKGQRLLDNAPCQAVAGLDSGALLLPINRALLVQAKVDRHARGSPSGGAGCEAD